MLKAEWDFTFRIHLDRILLEYSAAESYMITSLEPPVTNLLESIWIPLCVCSRELVRFAELSGVSLYAVILACHCTLFCLYACLYAVINNNP